jgi:hypothetical protein
MERNLQQMRFDLSLPCVLVALCTGCASPERLTTKGTPCSGRDVTIVPSEFQRQGVETAWCARCKDKVYQCVTNAARDKVQCFEAKEGGPCR